jgi:MFS family permease
VIRVSWRYRWTLLVACVLAYFATPIGQVAIGALVPAITGTFAVSAGTIGAALTGMWLAYALVQGPSGALCDRLGARRVALLAVGFAGVGALALATAPSFAVFASAVVALGAGVGLYYNAGTILLTRGNEAPAQAIGLHRLGGELAGIVTPVVAVAIAGAAMGWNGPVQAHVLSLLPAAERGAGFGVMRTSYILLGALGGVVTGTVADAAGWEAATWLLAVVLVCAAAVVLLPGHGRTA